MRSARVIYGMHADRDGAVVLRHIHRTAQADFQPGTGDAATTEEVDNDLALRAEAESLLSFEIEGVFIQAHI